MTSCHCSHIPTHWITLFCWRLPRLVFFSEQYFSHNRYTVILKYNKNTMYFFIKCIIFLYITYTLLALYFCIKQYLLKRVTGFVSLTASMPLFSRTPSRITLDNTQHRRYSPGLKWHQLTALHATKSLMENNFYFWQQIVTICWKRLQKDKVCYKNQSAYLVACNTDDKDRIGEVRLK